MDMSSGTPRSRAARHAPNPATAKAGPARKAAPELKLKPLDSLIGFHLRLAQEASFRGFSKRVGATEISPGRFAAMTIIHNNPGVNQAALGRAIARDKSSVTPLLQKLEKEGLVMRTVQENDGRSHGLRLTPAGETTLRALMRQALAHDRELDEIAGERKAELIALLQRITLQMG